MAGARPEYPTGPSYAAFSTPSNESMRAQRDLGKPVDPFLPRQVLVLPALCSENTFRTPRSVVLPPKAVPSSQESKVDAKSRFKDCREHLGSVLHRF